MDIFGNFSKLITDKKKRQVQRKEDLDYVYTDVTLEGIARVEDKEQVFSIFLVKSSVILLFLVLLFRLFVLQVVHGGDYQLKAEDNRIRPRYIEASRGIITDKDGAWLARNKPNFVLGLYPSDLPKKKTDRDEIYQKVAAISGLSSDDIRNQAEQNGLFFFDMIALKEDISHDDALLLEQKMAGLQGVVIAQQSSREYVALPGLGHILGYTGRISPEELNKNPSYGNSDQIGKAGIEAQYEEYLNGIDGVEQIEKDSKGTIVRILTQEGRRDPVVGNEISLYMDRGLQQKTAEALQNGINDAKTKTGDTGVNAGVAIVMDVNSGGILSMVSLPDYNNNVFSGKISSADYSSLMNDPNKPLLDRATMGLYPPGSISKIIMASAGLAEGTITPNTSMVTPAAIKIGDYTFPDWKDHSYESTNVERAIAESNDIFFYSLGGGYDNISGLGIDRIKKYWQLFGLGEKTGIDLPSEAAGLLPDDKWKRKDRGEAWYLGDTYHVSIGQGDLLITPVQMLRATAVIANGGKLLEPQLVQKIISPDGKVVKEFGPRIEKNNIVSSSVIKTVQEGMRMTVTDGSARSIFPADFPVQVAGKTGTAQFLDNQKTHAWFECYAPYNNPQIAVLVMVEGGGEGFDIAAPVAKDILNYYFTR